ncbi:kinesin-like protein KIF25 [Sarcophilus harrisii]
MPAKALNWSFITNQRIQQLKSQVRAKEERIVELETENAVLHLKLAECHGIIERSNSKTMQFCSLYNEEQHLRRNTYSNLTQIYQIVQKFKQELKDFQSFSYLLMRNFQHHYQDYLSQIVDAIQKAQIENENLQYGQTGSGKSYTMLGPHSESDPISSSEADQEMGIIPRAAGELFRLLSENQTVNPRVEVSVVEIYNNELFDLLAKDSSGIFGVKRDVITTKEGKSNVPLLTYELVESPAEFMRLINKSLQLRVKHPTLVHADSSRSHLVVTITLTISVPFDSFADQQSSQNLCKEILCITPQKVMKGEKPSFFSRGPSPAPIPLDLTEQQKQVQTKLQLVDLAGSECVGMSGVTGTGLRETSFINRSLAALADVLGALSEHRGHIPYRNSKLTHLLQDSIGGDAKLLVMLCVSPCQKYLAETLQSLGFGSRARQVQRVQAKRRNLLVSSKSK